MTLVFKTQCPKCGGGSKGKKNFTTKVDTQAGTYSKAKCYRCGFQLPGGTLK